MASVVGTVGLRVVGMVLSSFARAGSHFNSVALPKRGIAYSMPYLTNQRYTTSERRKEWCHFLASWKKFNCGNQVGSSYSMIANNG